MLSVQRVAQAAVIELMANRSLRRLATLLSVTALPEVIRMMSSSRAAPHQGSGCVTPPTQEAEYMAATVFPSHHTTGSPCFRAGCIYDRIGFARGVRKSLRFDP